MPGPGLGRELTCAINKCSKSLTRHLIHATTQKMRSGSRPMASLPRYCSLLMWKHDHVTPFLKALQRRLIVFSTESNLLVTAYKVLLGLVSAPPPPCTCVLQGVHTHVCAHRPGLKPTPPQGGSRVASSQPALWRHTPSQRCGTHLGSRRPIPAFSRPGPLSPTLSPAPWSLSTWVHSSGTAIGQQPWLQFHREPDP